MFETKPITWIKEPQGWMPVRKGYRNPIRLELVNHVVPLVIFVAGIAGAFCYFWAIQAAKNFGG